MRLYLLRHGQSCANLAGCVTGLHNDPLSQRGKDQVRRASTLRQIYGISFTHFFVSPWRRAQETAALFLPEVNFSSTFTEEYKLGETEAGKVANWTTKRFLAQYPEYAGPIDPSRPYPGGESHKNLYDRVAQWFSKMEKTMPEEAEILAVTHAGPICCLIQHICGMEMKKFPFFLAENASLTRLDRQHDNSWRLGVFSLTPPPLDKSMSKS